MGQSVAICERACVAVEAMEGTDAMLERAASLVNGKPLRLVKVSRRRGHLLFDVPVAGPGTIASDEEDRHHGAGGRRRAARCCSIVRKCYSSANQA